MSEVSAADCVELNSTRKIRIHGQVSIRILTTRNGGDLYPWLHYDAHHEDGPATMFRRLCQKYDEELLCK